MRPNASDSPQPTPTHLGDAGVCIWLTGRSGSGKSTVTAALLTALGQRGRTVTVLDTVPVLAKTRGEKTSEGKLLRKAFVASEVVRHGGVCICVTVSARQDVREKARQIVGTDHFLEVYFDISPEEAQARRVGRGSRRTLRKALRQVIQPVARLVSPRYRGGYEPPESPEVRLDPVELSPEQAAQAILEALDQQVT